MKQEIKIPAGCEVDAITTEEGADDVNLDNPGVANRNKANLEEEVAKMKQAKPLDSDDGTPSRLSPLFTEEMMGFPLMWTAFPFLFPSGEPNH